MSSSSGHHQLGRYALHREIASGGMATVYFGRLVGPAGFQRTVAIKRLHPQFAKASEFVDMFLDEARLAGRIKHPNVISILDVEALDGELFLVMEYVPGESLARLQQHARAAGRPIPLPIVSAIAIGMLLGLHAAHEARDEQGRSLEMVHRDVSPQNVLVGVDGVSRLLDFGIAKAVGRLHTTREGQLKGKLAFMPPEQIRQGQVDRRTDIYSAAVALYGATAGALPFVGDEASLLYQILHTAPEPASTLRPDIPPALDELIQKGMSTTPSERFATAHEMAVALEAAVPPATQLAVGAWVQEIAGEALAKRAANLLEVESAPATSKPAEPTMTPLPRVNVEPETTSDVSVAAVTPGPAHSPPSSTELDPLTEPTTIVTPVQIPAPPRSGATRWIVVGGVGVLAAAGLLLAASWGRSPAASPPAADPSAAKASPAASPAASPPVPQVAPEAPAPGTPGSVAPAVSAPSPAKPGPRAVPHAPRSAPSAKRPDYGF